MAKISTVAMADLIALALFAQRSPNLEFRERAFALALAAVAQGVPQFCDLDPLCQFAARSQAKGAAAQRARDVGKRLLRETGHAELQAQLQGSIQRPKIGGGHRIRARGRRSKQGKV